VFLDPTEAAVNPPPSADDDERQSPGDGPEGALGTAAHGTAHGDALEGVPIVQDRWLYRLLESGPQAFGVVDLKGRLIRANQAFSNLLGYSQGELLGMSILDLTAPQSVDLTRRSHTEVLATGANQRVIKKYCHRDGRLVPVELLLGVLRDDEGECQGLYAFITDISDRLKAEEALRDSEQRARALFDGIHDAVFVHDQAGRMLDANPAACRQLGYSREELLGMTTSQIDAPEFAAGFKDRLRRQLEDGELRCEGLHRTKSGKLIPVEVTTSTIQFDGQMAVLAILRDITERKALERTRREFAAAQMRNAQDMELKNRALSESEARYRQLAEGSLDAIIAADGDGRITLFNPASEKIFGYAAHEILARPLEQLIPGIFQGPQPGSPASASGAVTPDDSTRAATDSIPRSAVVGRTVELMGRKRDGSEFPLEISLNAVELSGRTQYVGSIRDQTERHRMRAVLAQTDKLASIGLLSAGVAHEINNPLAYVLNNLVVLQREVKGLIEMVALQESCCDLLARADPQSVGKIAALADEIDWPYLRANLEPLLERTRSGVERVAGIVGTMRGFARTSPPHWESVSLDDILNNALEMMRGRLKDRQIEVSIHIHEMTKIECLPDQIGQVLLNLLINAVQAIESTGRREGGRIVVDTRLIGSFVAISVSDNGPGIAPEHRDRLFDPFFTTKPVGEGTGLGLATSHGIVSGHGGRIEVESRLGEGSCFRILLPRNPRQGPTKDEKRTPWSAPCL
jgi:PAS domain S-box-containing protein